MALEHERLSSLIQFAQASAALKGSPPCDVASHPFYEYEHSLQGLPGLHFNAGGEEEEIWLVVERLHESPAPTPKQPLLALWMDVSNNPAKEPSLKSGIEFAKLMDGGFAELKEGHEPVDVKRLVLLQDFNHAAEVEAQLKAYMATQWTPWATEEKRRRRSIQLYGRLFTLKQQLEGSIIDAQIEIAMGVGMAVWIMAGVRVCYPIITRLADIQVNETTMAIEIRPRDIDARLELDIFTAADNPGTAELEKAYKDFVAKATQTFSPFDSGTFDGILRSAVAALDSKAIYWPAQTTADDRKLPTASEELKITNTWVLIARPRSKSLFVQDLERFKKALEEETSTILPKAIKAVLTEPATSNVDITLPGFRGISMVHGHEVATGSSDDVADLYFPMPFNDEQVRIVQMLECYDGVVVQGPPGTGKTHTIANIISHYFALGKRVLVTSMKEPALAVLRDKLPEDIRHLAISLLSNEQEGMKQFEHAIGKIAAEIQAIDRIAYKKDIAQLEQNIDALHAQLAGIDRKITSWAKKNLQPILMDEESVTPVDAAKEVVKGQGQYEWLEDKLTPASKLLFGNADIARLREARRVTANDMDYLGVALPEMAAFPDSRDLVRMHQNLSRHAELEAAVDTGDLPPLADSKDETIQAACALAENIKILSSLAQQMESADVEWTKNARKLFVQRSVSLAPVIEILDALGKELAQAIAQRNGFVAKPVSVPTGVELDEDVIQAIQNKANGKSAFGLSGLIGKSAAKKKLEEIRVLTDSPNTEEDWQHVYDYVMLQRIFRELVTRWNGVAPELAIGCFDVVEPAHALKAAEYFTLHVTIRKHIDLETRIITESKLLLPTWKRHSEITENTERLQELQQFLDSHILRHRLASAWAGKEQLQRILSNYNGRIIESFKVFVAEKLGNPSVADADMQAKWSSLMDELKRLHGLRSAFADISDITDKIEQSGAKKWAENLRIIPANNTADILLPDHWQTAWKLRRLATYLEAADAREELKKLARQRTDAEILLAKTYRNIVAKRTWLKLAENATPDIRSALEAFRTAIAKIGKGTGKRAVRYRQDARKAASRANRAIPCWIMPHWRISESLPPDFGCFDLVIIDEASQSDLSALPALLRAEKVLIVGDDKQVSPDGVGLEEEKIRNLMARYLANQVEHFRAQMTPERSIYDLFKVVFAQSSTMLKEHFRCVGPIIEYSKREFYNHELKPVRLPKVSERLDPPLVDVLVEDGYRSDKADINLPEARFIVDEIKKICADPAMQHRTIGVVSLLADKQALEVWKMLETELGPEAIGRHQIACGDARTFQGKERDIMFLSMVVSPGDAHAQTRESIAQRFNVAASRARDRMYLVHSIELDQLSPNDKLRRDLLSHFATPYMQDEQRVEDLRLRCESDFEREIYDVLTERGYRVIPQVKVGEYRIDMVVEGNNDTRLAVECDGDQYHGADRWEDDMHRQRILERVGWQFWRCFASTFVRNRKDIIDDLVASLTERGIDAIGSDTAPRSLHTEHRRVAAFPVIKETQEMQNDQEPRESAAG